MLLLGEAHRTWSVVPKTRSVMGGNEGGNSGISEVSLSKYELEVLSKNPKFVVRALMSKEKYLVEFEVWAQKSRTRVGCSASSEVRANRCLL